MYCLNIIYYDTEKILNASQIELFVIKIILVTPKMKSGLLLVKT